MSAQMTEEEMVRALMRQTGCDLGRAQAIIRRSSLIRATRVVVVKHCAMLGEQSEARPFAEWLHIDLPFGVLLPDNGRAKYGVLNGRMILTKRYRRAKEKIAELAEAQCSKWRPYEQPVCVDATLRFPPDKKRRDAPNYAKLVHDALKGIAYLDDSQIHSALWRRGPDSKTPTLHITISPFNPGT